MQKSWENSFMKMRLLGKNEVNGEVYSTILYCTVLYSTVLYCTVLSSTLLYCTLLYSVLLCTLPTFIVL